MNHANNKEMSKFFQGIHLVKYANQHCDQYADKICSFLRQLGELNPCEFGNWFELQVSYTFTGYRPIMLCEKQIRASIHNKQQRNPIAGRMTLLYYAGNHPGAASFLFHCSSNLQTMEHKQRNIISINLPAHHSFCTQPARRKELVLLLYRFWKPDRIFFCNESS